MKLHTFVEDVNSWSDFKNKLKNQPNHIKGALFEEWTKCFLQYSPVYRNKLKNVWLHEEVPSSVRSKLNLPSSDQGIDLIAETVEGSYWAIQCKYVQDETKKLTHRVLSTFISLSKGLANNISHCLISSTTEDYASLYKAKENIAFISYDEWIKLDQDFFNWIRSGNLYPPPKPIPNKPRAHQRQAIDDARRYFVDQENSRGKLVFPCGSGKSLIGYWIMRELNPRSVLIALPSLALVKQTLEVYLREAVANSWDVEWMCVCSDEGIGSSDDVLIHTNDLGVECVTDVERIAEWLKGTRVKNKIIFTTYQSGKTISKACSEASHAFDLGILDEAHKTVGSKSGLFSHLLFDENLLIHKRVFMTATERIYSGSSDTVLSMDDLDLYGATFSQLSFKAAIEQGLLSDYKIITLFISNKEVKELIKNNAFVRPDNAEFDEIKEARTLAAMIALRKAMTEKPINHALTFHSSIKRAHAFERMQNLNNTLFKGYASVEAHHVSGKMSTRERSRIIKEFKESAKGVVTNARCLTEGVDVPQIDCVLFADPRKSIVDIVQAAGRALRKHKGKDFGYILLPVYTNSQNIEEIIQSPEYSEILVVLRALAAHDERIIEYFRSKSNPETSTSASAAILESNLEEIVTNINADRLKSSIELAIWDKLAKLSWRPFEEAREFTHNLNLKSIDEWKEFVKSKKKPFDIPSNPNTVYSAKGWVNWGDWLGTYRIASYYKVYRPFEQARDYVRSLGLKGWEDWRKYLASGDKPFDIPSAPDSVYEDQGWVGMGDWLGTTFFHYRNRSLLSYEEAKQFVHALKLKSREEWNHFCKSGRKPDNIPHNPQNAYKENGWVSMSDWIGSEISNKNKVWMPFEDARDLVRQLKLKDIKEWYKYCKSDKRPRNMPANPNTVYKDLGWCGYGDWLGTGTVANFNKKYKSFEKARDYVHKLNLKSQQEWRTYAKTLRPDDIPYQPEKVYKTQGWISMGDWLGTGKVADQNINYLDFYTAREFVRSLGLKTGKEWKLYCKSKNKHPLIPLNAQRRYQSQGWVSMGDWLGTNSVANYNKLFREFSLAREFVRSLNLSGQKEWIAYCKSGNKPSDIPHSPHNTYKNKGWVSYGDWLGTRKIATRNIVFLPFTEARSYVRKLQLLNQKSWSQYCKSRNKPPYIPSNPQKEYKNKGWSSLGDWLGTGNVAAHLIVFKSFEDAKNVVKGLGLKTKKEWNKMCSLGLIPQDIPKTPYVVYKDRWMGWKDFLSVDE
jgi:superfamily II DNA or RNA helicase